MSANDAQKVRIAICFHDNDTECLRALETHLSPITRDGTIELWHRLKVLPGQPYEFALRGKLEQADIVILLVSADFNASWDARISAAVKMDLNATTRVIPIILRPCVWSDLPFYGLQPVPSDGQTLMQDGRIVEERFHRAALAVRTVIADFQDTRRKDIEPPTATAHSVVGTIAQLERERYWFTRAASCDVNTGRPLPRVDETKETPTPHTTPATAPTERHAPTTIDKLFAELELTGESSNARDSAPEQPTGEPAWRFDESTVPSERDSWLGQPTAVPGERPSSGLLQALDDLRNCLLIAIGPEAAYFDEEAVLSAATSFIRTVCKEATPADADNSHHKHEASLPPLRRDILVEPSSTASLDCSSDQLDTHLAQLRERTVLLARINEAESDTPSSDPPCEAHSGLDLASPGEHAT